MQGKPKPVFCPVPNWADGPAGCAADSNWRGRDLDLAFSLTLLVTFSGYSLPLCVAVPAAMNNVHYKVETVLLKNCILCTS